MMWLVAQAVAPARPARLARARSLALGAFLLGLSACATNPPPVTPGAPMFPDFVFPSAPARRAGAEAPADARLQADLQAAWQLLQAGEFRSAERDFASVASRGPAFYPAEVGLGYVNVAERRFKDALARFDSVVSRHPAYAPALAGRGDALLGLARPDDALSAFEAALSADPSLAEVKRRVEVLRFNDVRNVVAAARHASESGRTDEARRLYEQAISASPDSAFLYRDLGLVELAAKAAEQGAQHLQKATELDPGDARSWVGLGKAFEALGDLDRAADAYRRAMSLDPADSTRAALTRVRERGDRSKLPAGYRAIPTLPRITRADLAALIGVRFQQRLDVISDRVSSVITDTRGHWAAAWIIAVTRVGVMKAFPNHTFQPDTVVRRIDLAEVVSALLGVLGPVEVGPLSRRITDVGPAYIGYAAIATAVSAGVLPLLDKDTFQPSRPVGGAEAVDALERLDRLLPPRRSSQEKTAP